MPEADRMWKYLGLAVAIMGKAFELKKVTLKGR